MSSTPKTVAKSAIIGAAGDKDVLSPIEDILEDVRNGRMVILVDDEDRENEGDLVIPAQMITPEGVNFMAKYGRGLICLAMTQQRVGELGLSLMPQRNNSRLSPAFTVSIEAREGVTTGISAQDRWRTIQAAIDTRLGPEGITTPGHIFPLASRDGGVLVRAGHTEASVDLARLAGLYPAGVICEIMNDDGSMSRLSDLVPFAQLHGLKIGAIADLIAYRRRHDRIVERLETAEIDTLHGGRMTMHVYANRIDYSEHIALVKGDVTQGGPVLVRMHAVDVLDDLLGDTARGKARDLDRAMAMINQAGRGVVVLIREPRPTALSERLRARREDSTVRQALRDYGVGAHILLDLGIREMVLISSTDKIIIALDGYGLSVVERRPIA